VTVATLQHVGRLLVGVGFVLAALANLNWTWLRNRIFEPDPPGATPEFADDLHGMVEEFRDHHAEINDLLDDELNPATRMDQAAVDAEFAAIAADVADKLGTDFTGPDVDFQTWEQDMPNTPSIQRLLLELENPPLRYRVVWDDDTGEPSFVDLTSTGRNRAWVTA
jgi:hypothetical protein